LQKGNKAQTLFSFTFIADLNLDNLILYLKVKLLGPCYKTGQLTKILISTKIKNEMKNEIELIQKEKI